jgi:hypothetical protein
MYLTQVILSQLRIYLTIHAYLKLFINIVLLGKSNIAL